MIVQRLPFFQSSLFGLFKVIGEWLQRLHQSAENHRKEYHRFWLCLRHAVLLISNVWTSTLMKISRMALIWILTVMTTAFERTKENFYGFQQTAVWWSSSPFKLECGLFKYIQNKVSTWNFLSLDCGDTQIWVNLTVIRTVFWATPLN